MYRVNRTFPYHLPLSVGQLIDGDDMPNLDYLVNDGYLEPVEYQIGVDTGRTGGDVSTVMLNSENERRHELHIIDEADPVGGTIYNAVREMKTPKLNESATANEMIPAKNETLTAASGETAKRAKASKVKSAKTKKSKESD